MPHSPLLIIQTEQDDPEHAEAVAQALGYPYPDVIEGTPADAAYHLKQHGYSPRYVVLFVAGAGYEILDQIDELAEYCEPKTRAVMVGTTNDIAFYREVRKRGIIEYFNYPPPISELCHQLVAAPDTQSELGRVIACISGASGDGATTVAMNLAYLLASEQHKRTVLVDLDYQFGTIAPHLELQDNYSTKEIFEHPERGVDSTLIKRMVCAYRKELDVIVAPQRLAFMPTVTAELVHEFVTHLAANYDYVVLDLPHVWTQWVATTASMSQRVLVVAQLLLKSVTHTARLINTFEEMGLNRHMLSVVVNRSGSRYKEALHPKDLERILNCKVNHYLPNEIRTIAKSENKGLMLKDFGDTPLLSELRNVVNAVMEERA